jgi:hypothetical protein
MSWSTARWFPVWPDVRMMPGATVSAVTPSDGHLNLFATGTDGTVWSTWFEDGNWHRWYAIWPDVRMMPGAAIMARQNSLINAPLFTTAVDGTVWSTFLDENYFWRPWQAIHPKKRMYPGVTGSLLMGRTYVLDSRGVAWITELGAIDDWWASPETAWWRYYLAWSDVRSDTRLHPAGGITVVVSGVRGEHAYRYHTDLFACGVDGTVWSTYWETDDSGRAYVYLPPSDPGEGGAEGGTGLGPGAGGTEEGDDFGDSDDG